MILWSKQRYRLTVLKTLSPLASGAKRFLLLNLLISLFLMGLGFIKPLFYKIFINDVILGRRPSLMLLVAGGYLAVFALNLICVYAKNFCNNIIVNRLTFRVRMKMLQGFFSEDFCSYETQSVGDMKMRLDDDTSCISAFAGAQSVDYLIALVTIPIALVLMFAIEWRMTLFSCFSIPLTLLLDHLVARQEAVVLDKQRENDQKMSTWLHMSIQGWREIKALNLQKHEERQFASYIHKYAVFFGTWINYWVLRVLVLPKIKTEFVMQFSLYFIGGLLIIAGHLEIGDLLVFIQYNNILTDAVTVVSSTDAELLSLQVKSDRMLAGLSKKDRSHTNTAAPGEIDFIEFKDVSFSYPGSENHIISKLSFSIHKGECVAITGPSGAGKTTVLKLLTGMLLPSEGKVLISGVETRDISLKDLHRRIGFIMQENTLFNATIHENLMYSKKDASSDELESACRKACIWDFIQSLPEGLDTVIGEKGIKLSGGQKQRLVLARQFLRDVEIFIFDEATNALDQYSESIINDALASIGKDKTIIIVSHRSNSLALCNREIMVPVTSVRQLFHQQL
jgi:ATP-binding cassette subfamily B protein/subfamily B ATP-binding cassette protein MsbA